MTRTLIIIDATLDPLWRYHPGNCGAVDSDSTVDSALIYNIDEPDLRPGYPYLFNLFGWQRWFRDHNIQSLYLYTLSKKVWILYIAALLNRLSCTLHLTGPIRPNEHRTFRSLTRWAQQVICPADFVARQVKQLGISSSHITITQPSVRSITTESNPRIGIRCYFMPESDPGPLLLALESPSNYTELKTTAWAAAMLYHVYPNTRLVISGRCDNTLRNKIESLQTIWNCPGLIRIAGEEFSWEQLMSTCDILVGGSGSGRELIRLCAASLYDIPLILPGGSGSEMPGHRSQTHFVNSALPRHIATVLLKCLDERCATAAAGRL